MLKSGRYAPHWNAFLFFMKKVFLKETYYFAFETAHLKQIIIRQKNVSWYKDPEGTIYLCNDSFVRQISQKGKLKN